ncbi:hypothetical protein ACWCXX_37880 [Streptomyces sp. NPDC001732]
MTAYAPLEEKSTRLRQLRTAAMAVRSDALPALGETADAVVAGAGRTPCAPRPGRGPTGPWRFLPGVSRRRLPLASGAEAVRRAHVGGPSCYA